MKLLFDQKLSPKLVKSLEDIFPNSNHVFPLGLDKSDDTEVWEYARDNDFILVTKDADFGDLSIPRSFPPKVIWIVAETAKLRTLKRFCEITLKR